MQRTSAIKCVLVGNPMVGKSSLVVAYTSNGFSDIYVPTAFDNYSVTVNVDNKPLRMDLCDTAGRAEFDSLRPLSYAEADVFLLCFKITDLASFNSIMEHWLPEIRAVSPNVPVILVGTQHDMRMNYNTRCVVDLKRVRRLAEQLNIDYIECSSLTHRNLKEVFDLAIVHGIQNASQRYHASPIPKKSAFSSNVSYSALPEKTKPPTSTSFKASFRRLVTMTKKAFVN